GHFRPQLPKDFTPGFAVAADVEHEPAAGAGGAVHGEAGQFLERLQHLAPLSDQFFECRPHNGDQSTVAFDVHVDVTVEVGDVEQALDVVGCDVAFPFERLDIDGGGLLRLFGHRHSRAGVRPASGVAVAHDKLSPYVAALYAVRCVNACQGLSPTRPRSGR